MSKMIKQCASTVDLIYKMNLADLEQAERDIKSNIRTAYTNAITGINTASYVRQCKKEAQLGKYLLTKIATRIKVLLKELKET